MRLREWTFTIDDSEVEHRVKECQKEFRYVSQLNLKIID